MRHKLWSGFAAIVLTGCANEIVSGGPVGAGGATTSSATTGAGGAPMLETCGGKQGLTCGPGKCCKWDDVTPCGYADGSGVCLPRPTACDDDCPGVCGCDGSFHCNACMAAAAGLDVGPTSESCLPDAGGPDSYDATMIPNDQPVYVITKTEHAADRCVVLTVTEAPGPNPFGIQVSGDWKAVAIFMTPSAADCQGWSPTSSPPLPPIYAKAKEGSGTIVHDQVGLPCSLSVHVQLTLDGSAPWVPATETLDADGLIVHGTCSP